jgi:hypothetical protein
MLAEQKSATMSRTPASREISRTQSAAPKPETEQELKKQISQHEIKRGRGEINSTHKLQNKFFPLNNNKITINSWYTPPHFLI